MQATHIGLAVALLLPLTAPLRAAMAFDDHGHRIVALVADHYLLPEARKKINAMLAADTDALAPNNLAAAATWADRYMESGKYTDAKRYEATRRWHFASITSGRPSIPAACFGQRPLPGGTPASQGPAEACIIDKIDQFAASLADPRTEPSERLLALKYLLNLVGDIHQPLRVADEHDNHGMLTRVAAEDKSITPGTLFGYWDVAIPRRLGPDLKAVADKLVAGITEENRRQWSGRITHLWALEAHQLGADFAYGTMLSESDPLGHFVVAPAEIKRAEGIVATQLSKAGVRLALVLNDALIPASRPGANTVSPVRGNVRGGRELALASCAVCHVVAPDQKSPREFTYAPDFSDIANTVGADYPALREFLFGPHPSMPSLRMTGEEANDVIAFILSLRTRP